ncbi:MAG: SDR family oxidoreductase [Chloroflexi bacterium]|nr:SDR family oxidoreductase [Chloroflexota bacterium]
MLGNRLEGKVIIVTGGGHGLGEEYCRALAAEGARVAVADIDKDAAWRVAAEIGRRGGIALASHTDVSDEASTLAMATTAVDHFSRIDVLINNAAIVFAIKISRVPVDQLDVKEWDRVMAVNTRGTFLCTKAVVPLMKAQGGGKIINVASSTVIDGSPMRSHYVTSKAANIGFTRCVARELGEFNITVNCLAPGSILSAPDDAEAVMIARRASQSRCLKRVGLPKDMVGTVVFLCSPDSDFITGQTIVVNGGANFV